VNFVALLQQQIGEIRSVLAGDSRDERFLHASGMNEGIIRGEKGYFRSLLSVSFRAEAKVGGLGPTSSFGIDSFPPTQ
jgi:hypothetical protein